MSHARARFGWTYLDNGRSQAVLVADRVHVSLQIHVEEFKHEIELGVRVDDVEQSVWCQ